MIEARGLFVRGVVWTLVVAHPGVHRGVVAGAALFAQSEAGGNPLFGMLSSGGVGIALIVVVQMFLKEMRETTRESFSRFEAKLDAIESRHAQDEAERHEQMRNLVDRMLENQERLAVSQERLNSTLGELRRAVDGLAVTTSNNDRAILALEKEIQSLRSERGGGGLR